MPHGEALSGCPKIIRRRAQAVSIQLRQTGAARTECREHPGPKPPLQKRAAPPTDVDPGATSDEANALCEQEPSQSRVVKGTQRTDALADPDSGSVPTHQRP